MFLHKKVPDVDTHLGSFTHCWLHFHMCDDTYVARISSCHLSGSKLSLICDEMCKCREFIVDRYGTKQWDPVRHFRTYTIWFIYPEELHAILSEKPEASHFDLTSTFKLGSGDILTFTKDPKEVRIIEEILHRPMVCTAL